MGLSIHVGRILKELLYCIDGAVKLKITWHGCSQFLAHGPRGA